MDEPPTDVETPQGQQAHVPLPWRRAALVCRKCAGKRHDGLDADGQVRLRREIRAALEAAGITKKSVRVAETTCLGLCPDAGITVLVPGIGTAQTRVHVVRTDADRDRVVAALRVDIDPSP